jgi:tRNA A37 N6-isopentenylltransferase MiaA
VRLPARARSTRQQDAQLEQEQPQQLVQALEQQQLVLAQQLEQEQPQQLALP